LIAEILTGGLAFNYVDGKLIVRGDPELIKRMTPAIKRWKPELLKVMAGETVGNVGRCDQCNADLLGLITFDGYVNRVCPVCGCWKICLQPRNTTPAPTTTAKPVCIAQPITLF